MGSTRITRHVNARRARVYAAFVDAKAVATWRRPDAPAERVHFAFGADAELAGRG